jgi:hypothetical protein
MIGNFRSLIPSRGEQEIAARKWWRLMSDDFAIARHHAGTEMPSSGMRPCAQAAQGFSLAEMLVSLTVMLVVTGGIIALLSVHAQTYGRTELQSDMYENVRGVAELMEQEVGQAGLVNLPATAPTLSAAIAANPAAQTVNVSSTASMYQGEQLLIDAGTNEELVTTTAVGASTISGIFGKAHASGATISVLGIFPNGIVPPGATDGSTSVAEPGVGVLNLYGDILGDGSLVYVRYTCDTSSTPGTLSRSVTTINPGINSISTSQTLLSTLIPNPGGTACFQFTSYTATLNSTTYTIVTNVGLNISVRSLNPDPVTGQYLTMTKSFLDLSPRNLLAAFEQANAGNAGRLQAAPANIASY